jgi:hypothetical protein
MAYFVGLCVVHALWIARVVWGGSTPTIGLIGLLAATTLGAALVLAEVRAGKVMFLLAGGIEVVIFALISVAGMLGTGLAAVGGHPDTLKALLSLGLTILVAVYVLIGLLLYSRSTGGEPSN